MAAQRPLHRFTCLAITAAMSTLACAGPAAAHGSEASIVLLLPTGYYMLGAAFAVAASFILLAIIPERWVSALATARIRLGSLPTLSRVPASTAAFVLLVVLLAAGLFGTRDPVENPLPSVIWTLWWVCFTIIQAFTGSLWPHLNPWTGPLTLLARLIGRPLSSKPAMALPATLGYGIAIVQFAGFAWFELIDLAPSDPDRLAVAVAFYWLVNFIAMFLFGEAEWTSRAEPFSIFFRLIGLLSPLARQRREDGRTDYALVWPGQSLITLPGLPLSGVLFILLALSTVSFDGLSKTFLWLGAIGINPLEFPGRSAVLLSGTLGMVGAFALLSAGFLGAVLLGLSLIGRVSEWRQAAGLLVFSIMPIALAFQCAHYLTSVLVDGQNALIALSDPFARGWNLFGTAEMHTTTSFLNTLSGVTWIFNIETAAIIVGHVAGIIIAHAVALRLLGNGRAAMISQIPLAALMVFYTAFGLWLLSTPQI